MINVSGLYKSYGSNEVLRGVDLALKKNEIFGLLGPNGAGKTTMLEIMEGLRLKNAGTIDIMGEAPEEAVRSGIVGVQLQSSSLPEVMTPLDAMTWFCRWRGVEVRTDLLERFGLEGHLKNPTSISRPDRSAACILRWRWRTTRKSSFWTNRPRGLMSKRGWLCTKTSGA